jgi:hypothetical protein
LAPAAITPENLDEMLDRQTRLFIQNSLYNRYEPWQQRFYASKLLKQYRRDIERDFTTLWAFLQRYAAPEQSQQIAGFPPRISWMSFDKSLNAAVPTMPQ